MVYYISHWQYNRFLAAGWLHGDRLFFADLPKVKLIIAWSFEDLQKVKFIIAWSLEDIDRAFWAFARGSIAAARPVWRMELRREMHQRQTMEDEQHGNREVAPDQ